MPNKLDSDSGQSSAVHDSLAHAIIELHGEMTALLNAWYAARQRRELAVERVADTTERCYRGIDYTDLAASAVAVAAGEAAVNAARDEQRAAAVALRAAEDKVIDMLHRAAAVARDHARAHGLW